MSDKRNALEPILEKVGKFFALLGSENPNEAATALAKMNDILKKAGLDIHDVWKIGFVDNKEELAALLASMFAKDVDLLVKIGKEQASYFLNDAPFAEVMVNGHRCTYPVESKAFAQFLRHRFILELERPAASSAIKSAALTLAALAEFGAK